MEGLVVQTNFPMPTDPEGFNSRAGGGGGTKGHLVWENQAKHQKNGSYSNPALHFIATLCQKSIKSTARCDFFVTGLITLVRQPRICPRVKNLKIPTKIINFNVRWGLWLVQTKGTGLRQLNSHWWVRIMAIIRRVTKPWNSFFHFKVPVFTHKQHYLTHIFSFNKINSIEIAKWPQVYHHTFHMEVHFVRQPCKMINISNVS